MEPYYSNQEFRPYRKHLLPSQTRYNQRFNSFKLEFGISNPKVKQPLSPSAKQLDQSIDKLSITQYCHQPFYRHSSTFYSPKSKSVSRSKNTNPSYQLPEMQYVRSGFPKRKKKTGQQQYLKLLLKFADISTQSNKKKQILKDPLHEGSESNKNVGPRLKVKNTMKWNKSRYCVNRDKQMGMFLPEFTSKQFRKNI